MINALSVDVEDYYQVSAFRSIVKFTDWSRYESRLASNIDKLLTILAEEGVRATFFILGWVAENYPEIVRRIRAAGHEIASHGYAHRLVYEQKPDEFLSDFKKSLDITERITGNKILGFRAASFSITKETLWALDILKQQGLKYDSSIFPIVHDLYGIPDAPRYPYRVSEDFWEFPMSTVQIMGRNLPLGGGGYLRLYPYCLTRWGIRRINREGKPAIVYLHPWELDPHQPRIEGSFFSKLRHYQNLRRTEGILRSLCRDFKFATVREVLGV